MRRASLSAQDARGALEVITLLGELASSQAVVCSLHQPSPKVWGKVPQFILLSRGKTLYCGETGDAAAKAFSNLGAPVPSATSPADHFIDVADDDAFVSSAIAAASDGPAARKTRDLLRGPAQQQRSTTTVGAVSFGAQFGALLLRARRHNQRNPAFYRALQVGSLGALALHGRARRSYCSLLPVPSVICRADRLRWRY